jgi:hypothetical protein
MVQQRPWTARAHQEREICRTAAYGTTTASQSFMGVKNVQSNCAATSSTPNRTPLTLDDRSVGQSAHDNTLSAQNSPDMFHEPPGLPVRTPSPPIAGPSNYRSPSRHSNPPGSPSCHTSSRLTSSFAWRLGKGKTFLLMETNLLPTVIGALVGEDHDIG